MPTTLVLGASTNPERYSYKAIVSLKAHGHDVVAISSKEGELLGVKFEKSLPEFGNVDTVALYVNSKIQEGFYADIIRLNPRRVVFNPGTENPTFEAMLNANKIQTVQACTLVMLSIGNY